MFRQTATVLAILFFVATHCWATPPKNGISWETDLLKARAKALASQKPILIVFGAEWCVFCKKMENTTLSEKEMVKSINEQFVPVHLDFDKSKPIAKALKVEKIPSSLVISTDAELLSRRDGFVKPEEYREVLAKGLRAHKIRLTSGKSSTLN